jgi:periplasmic protein TonB
MAIGDSLSPRERRLAWAASIGVTLLIGFGLFAYRFPEVISDVSDSVSVIALNAPEPPPPPPVPAEIPKAPEAEGAAAPPNERNNPTPIVAPPPRIRPLPAPVAAPIEGTGRASESGAAETPGPGTGAGGQGTGRGAGLGGDGTGGGGGARARKTPSGIGYRNWPQEIAREDRILRVEVRFWVETNGRVTGCETQRTSGIAALDASTCRLIEQRFRYEPARNNAGEPVRAEMAWQQTWEASRGE